MSLEPTRLVKRLSEVPCLNWKSLVLKYLGFILIENVKKMMKDINITILL